MPVMKEAAQEGGSLSCNLIILQVHNSVSGESPQVCMQCSKLLVLTAADFDIKLFWLIKSLLDSLPVQISYGCTVKYNTQYS